jgi:uncharacterized membrane protein
MTENQKEDRLAHWVHKSLLFGVVLSGIVLGVGLFQDAQRGPNEPAGEHDKIGEVIQGSEHADGVSLINLGLLLLMATPVLRIAVLTLGWFMTSDRRFAVIALAVLVLLAISIVLGVG